MTQTNAEFVAELREGAKENLHCNTCGAHIYWPERGIVPFDGRFCDQDCKNAYDYARAHHVMRPR
jgi:predicted nucleic acid-binding Zn ribbon protein